MKDSETLDEAIDRVATQVTRGDETRRVDIRPVWTETSPAFAQALWRGRSVAIVVVVVALLLAVLIIRTPRVDQRVADTAIAVSPVIVWSPLHAPVSDARIQRVEERAGVARDLRAWTAVEVERPSWGIPFIDPPAALDVAASTTPAIAIESVGVEAIDVGPLTIDAIDRDGTTSPKEQ